MLTTLTKEALPLLRYRTGDISSLDDAPCRCGRTTIRMARVRARYDDMLIVRGVNLYPCEVERILLNDGAVAAHYQLVLERPQTMDELTVLCEPAASSAGVRPMTSNCGSAWNDRSSNRPGCASPYGYRSPAQSRAAKGRPSASSTGVPRERPPRARGKGVRDGRDARHGLDGHQPARGVGLPADDIRAWHAAGSALASTIAATPGTLDAARRRRVST